MDDYRLLRGTVGYRDGVGCRIGRNDCSRNIAEAAGNDFFGLHFGVVGIVIAPRSKLIAGLDLIQG